jgi:predicted dehydrogenase
MSNELSRRDLLKNAALVGGLAALGGVWTDRPARASRSPNEKLNIACIGVGGMGAADLNAVSSENIVALCDVDERSAAGSFKKYPDVPKYADFRQMLEKEGKRIDAVTVSTPDHVHAVASVMAMKMGKHVYCQKPLTRTPSEARIMMEVARKQRVVTQMGTQGHPAYARLVEYVQAGVIGKITEVHVMTDRPIWPQGMDRPTDTPSVPDGLNWELWQGPIKPRPYHPAYLPFVWRGWWDYGTGALGDMACHLMDGAFWALNLTYPTTVEAEGEPRHPDSAPKWSIVRYEFPKRGDMPPVKLTWYDGGRMIPEDLLEGQKIGKDFNGSLFIGEKGKMLVYHGSDPILLPQKDFEGFQPPAPTLPRSPGHYIEWINACKGQGKTASNFDYACPMTESILLGNVAFRLGKKITYDSRRMKAVGMPEADEYIQHQYRKGWSL